MSARRRHASGSQQAAGKSGDILVVVDRRSLAQSLAGTLSAPDVSAAVMTEPGLDGTAPSPSVPGRSAAIVDAAVGAPGEAAALSRLLDEAGWVVIVLWHTDDLLAAAACLEAGAAVVLPADASLEDVAASVRAVREGRHPPEDRALRERLLTTLHRTRRESARLREPIERLTPRERQVLEQLTEGRRADEIADDWVVSVVTVRNQIQSVLTKLGVRSQLEAAALARRAGWPSPHPD